MRNRIKAMKSSLVLSVHRLTSTERKDGQNHNREGGKKRKHMHLDACVPVRDPISNIKGNFKSKDAGKSLFCFSLDRRKVRRMVNAKPTCSMQLISCSWYPWMIPHWGCCCSVCFCCRLRQSRGNRRAILPRPAVVSILPGCR